MIPRTRTTNGRPQLENPAILQLGMAKKYAEILRLQFPFATKGTGIIEYDNGI